MHTKVHSGGGIWNDFKMILEKELWPFNSFRNQSNIEQLIFPAGTKKRPILLF